jgi:DNA-binding transcriptional regulator YiaG
MNIEELRRRSGMTRPQFSEYFGIPYRTIQDWELGNRKCPAYLLELMEYKLRNEGRLCDDADETAAKIKELEAELAVLKARATN